jgi:hypothetical protein
MLDNKDYDKMTVEELLAAQKKIKQRQTASAVIIGFSIGVMTYGLVKNGFGFLYVFIPLLLVGIIYRESKNLQQSLIEIQTAINNKNEN